MNTELLLPFYSSVCDGAPATEIGGELVPLVVSTLLGTYVPQIHQRKKCESHLLLSHYSHECSGSYWKLAGLIGQGTSS